MNETIVQFEKIPIPYRASEYVRVYAPQPDVYTGVQTAHFTPGERFESWICNDFSILHDGDDWHMVGITHPCPPGFADAFRCNPESLHEAEYQLFHCRAHAGRFEELLRESSFADCPKILYPAEREGERPEIWAPQLMKHGQFEIVYSPGSMRMARTADFVHFERSILFDCAFPMARDPYILEEDGRFFCVYCDLEGISLRESADGRTWSEPVLLVKELFSGAACESPCLFKRGKYYYLLWSICDARNGMYDERTFVYAAERLLDIGKYAPLTVLDAHAAEVVRDGDDYYLLSVFYPENGVSAARLAFRNDD